MILVDSHCHLDHLEISTEDALQATHENHVKHVLSVGLDPEQSKKVIEIAEAHPGIVSASIGIHPTEKIERELSTEELITLSDHSSVVAIGETGLDFYREFDQQLQESRFKKHIRAARETQKPLIIHSRQARAETIHLLKQEKAYEVGGVMHCFTETWEMSQEAMDLGFYISFSGIITFKNAVELQELVKKVPLDKMLIETDAPYLAPHPYRGKANMPAYVKYVAEKIAELKQESLENVAAITSRNFFSLFKQADRREYV